MTPAAFHIKLGFSRPGKICNVFPLVDFAQIWKKCKCNLSLRPLICTLQCNWALFTSSKIYFLLASFSRIIITNYGGRSWGRDLEENETFLLLFAAAAVLWQGTQFMTKSGFEIMKCFHFFFSLSGSRARVCVSFKEESCTTITPKALEKTGLVWKTIVKM